MNPLEAALFLFMFAMVRFVLPTAVLLTLGTWLNRRNARLGF